MAFMVIFGFVLAIAILLVNWRTIRRTYFGPEGPRNLLALFFALVSALAAVVTVFVLRELYLPKTDEIPHWWRSIQGLDAFFITLLLVMCGILFFNLKSWYRRNPVRRFAFVMSLLASISGAGGLAHALSLESSSDLIRRWRALLIAGVAALVLCIVRNRKSLLGDLRELLRSEDY